MPPAVPSVLVGLRSNLLFGIVAVLLLAVGVVVTAVISRRAKQAGVPLPAGWRS
jgi:hypothetical protein